MEASGGSVLTPRFAASPIVQRELKRFHERCPCTERIEAARKQMHQSLDKVLVIDMRFGWNGVGNSMVRWLALLRFGTAAGRATFLWMSDRDSHNDVARAAALPNETVHAGGGRKGSVRRSVRTAAVGRRLGAKGLGVKGGGARGGVAKRGGGKGRGGKAAGDASGVPVQSGGIGAYPSSKFSPSIKEGKTYRPFRANGFDLGDYFVSIGADYRWSKATSRRVRAAMAGRNVSVPMIASYYCRYHSWACMQPTIEWGPMDKNVADRLETESPGTFSYLNAGYVPGARGRMACAHDQEHEGALLSWLASREEPWILWRMQPEQTGIEPSSAVSGMAMSGMWAAYANARLPTHVCTPTLRDVGRGWGWRGRGSQWDEIASQIPRQDWSKWQQAAFQASRSGRGRGHETSLNGNCESFAVLRPRRWLQRRLQPYLDELKDAGTVVGLHMRTGAHATCACHMRMPHARMPHAHMHMHKCTCINAHMHTCTHAHMHTRTHALIRTGYADWTYYSAGATTHSGVRQLESNRRAASAGIKPEARATYRPTPPKPPTPPTSAHGL